MKTLTDEQLNRLPKWAQRHIQMLEGNMREKNKTASDLFSADPDKVEVELPYFYSADGVNHDHQPLPRRQSVRFYLPHPNPILKGRMSDVTVKLDTQSRGILITASEPIGITPNASNSVNVRMVQR